MKTARGKTGVRETPVFALLILALLLAGAADADARDRRVPLEFQRLHPCPSTGRTTGACPGWVRDHIVPLCKGGSDSLANMQWQTRQRAKLKDQWECRR